MPTQSEFIANPLFVSFVPPKYPIAVVDDFLTIADAELAEHKACMGAMYDRILFYLTAHRLTKWGASAANIEGAIGEVLSVSEIRQIASSLSVSDESGSESVTFQPNSSNSAIDSSPEDFTSTQYGVLYLSLYKKFKCRTTWMVV